MTPPNAQVAAMVRRELARDPQVGNDVLRTKATAIDGRIRRMPPRQFHATYRLPALRAASKNGGAPAAPVSQNGGAPTARTERVSAGKQPTRRAAAVAPEVAQSPAPNPPPAAGGVPPASGSSMAPPAAAAPAAGTPTTKTTALARPHAAEREAVRAILQTVAREALSTEDRTAFVRLLDRLDERATMILGVFGRR